LFSDAAWWTADPVDLSVCDFTQKPVALTSEQRRDFLQGEYLFWLFGNDRIRLMLIPDPCYQTEYGGSNAFLLYRAGGKVVVSQVLDGYFSRADNSVGLDFARLNAEQIVEVSTGSGGLNPSLTDYYFAIDPRTNQVINIFRVTVHGNAEMANVRYISGFYDQRAVDLFFNETRSGALPSDLQSVGIDGV